MFFTDMFRGTDIFVSPCLRASALYNLGLLDTAHCLAFDILSMDRVNTIPSDGVIPTIEPSLIPIDFIGELLCLIEYLTESGTVSNLPIDIVSTSFLVDIGSSPNNTSHWLKNASHWGISDLSSMGFIRCLTMFNNLFKPFAGSTKSYRAYRFLAFSGFRLFSPGRLPDDQKTLYYILYYISFILLPVVKGRIMVNGKSEKYLYRAKRDVRRTGEPETIARGQM